MTVQIIIGDAREQLKGLSDCSVQTCVTSPPYFGLRDYGVDGQMGLEATPDEFVAGMVDLFREVRRVLRDDGTLWLNLGDSYAGSGRGIGDTKTSNKGNATSRDMHDRMVEAGSIGRFWVKPPQGLKQKDLIGIPWRVAFALQADGWYLRQDIIWSKPNPMPESVRDRCTKAHEYIFLLSKGPKYYYDQDAILEPVSPNTHARVSQDVINQVGSARAHAGGKTNGNMKAVVRNPKQAQPGSGIKNNSSFADAVCLPVSERNKRSVWTVATQPFKGAHFATFPPALIEPCILAGSPVGGMVLDPFGGAGTTGLVANRLGRNATLIELNPEYAEMARRRIRADLGRVESQMPDRHDDAGPLFGSVSA
ncbi:DNA-methyltransferase [Sphingopyxis flava]|uniref:Methyltransferase n=1 Tax=Sphingopyxis flava TaxID=1507287 RepID=A0A1T5ABB6_9SPHN|nr:site-specific DNA-methyltransferase [Sphingopyxis flava]SKB32195.1 DNA modification methylase [Sphingopyxis flava]